MKVRCLPKGMVFFPNARIMEVSGSILHAQLLESHILNILGFSTIEMTPAARMVIAALPKGVTSIRNLVEYAVEFTGFAGERL